MSSAEVLPFLQKRIASKFFYCGYRVFRILSYSGTGITYLAYDLLTQGELRVIEEIRPDIFLQLPEGQKKNELIGRMIVAINQIKLGSVSAIIDAFSDDNTLYQCYRVLLNNWQALHRQQLPG